MGKDSNIPPQGFLKRSSKLLGLAAQLAVKEISARAMDKLEDKLEKVDPKYLARIEQAKLLAQTLGELKGAAMKLGQLLSLDAGDYLPPEMVKILSQLQNQVSFMPQDKVEEILKSQWDKALYYQVKVDYPARAAASIGQVHFAQFQGQHLAIKIQYPGIGESIDSDVEMLKKLLSGLSKISPKKVDFKPLLEEMKFVLRQEADYHRELSFLDRYHQMNQNPFFKIPRSIPELSGKKILAMEWMEGISLNTWIEQKPSNDKKVFLAQQILELYLLEFFQWGMVQTDPNFANFLIQDSIDGFHLVLLDMGATLEYSLEFRQSYQKILHHLIQDNTPGLLEESFKFGLLDPRESPEVQNIYLEMMKVSLEPFMPEKQPFDFNDEEYAKKSKKNLMEFVRAVQFTPPPRQLIFLHRRLGGMFALLKKMDIKLNLNLYLEQLLKPIKEC